MKSVALILVGTLLTLAVIATAEDHFNKAIFDILLALLISFLWRLDK